MDEIGLEVESLTFHRTSFKVGGSYHLSTRSLSFPDGTRFLVVVVLIPFIIIVSIAVECVFRDFPFLACPILLILVVFRT